MFKRMYGDIILTLDGLDQKITAYFVNDLS